MKYKDILRAGPDKTLIVYGANFLNAKPASDTPATVFTNMWRRYGLYRYDIHQGIEPVRRGVVWDAYALEKARSTSFVQGLLFNAERMALPEAFRRQYTERNAAALAAYYKIRMGPEWEAGIRQHRQELQDWLDSVRKQGMEFQIAALPLASWHKPLPYTSQYRAMLEEFCATNHVPLIDCSNVAEDDDFADHIHVNARACPRSMPRSWTLPENSCKKKGFGQPRPGQYNRETMHRILSRASSSLSFFSHSCFMRRRPHARSRARTICPTRASKRA